MIPLHCACYARFSSDRQSVTSIADQVRKCREFAARQGWNVLDQHIYTDEAISATSTERPVLTTSPDRDPSSGVTDPEVRFSTSSPQT